MTQRGIAIHIGTDTVDAAAYPKVPARLQAAEKDAVAMAALTTRGGFAPSLLCGVNATRGAVERALEGAATELVAGDLLVLTFSGHGGRFADTVGPGREALPAGAKNLRRDEPDDQDESWCLHDGVLIDDRIYELLSGFKAGVRILALSDSCFSGSVLRLDQATADGVGDLAASAEPTVRSSVVLIAACADDRVTHETEDHGQFTAAVLTTWDGGAFRGCHHVFYDQIVASVRSAQLSRYGAYDPDFEATRPFTIHSEGVDERACAVCKRR